MKHSLTDLRDHHNSQIDLFICSASFEERCLSVAKNLDAQLIKKVLIASNIAYSDAIKENYKQLTRFFEDKYSELKVDSNKPVSTADCIVKRLMEHCDKNNPQNILIDISTFTHESLLMLYAIGRFLFKPTDSVTFLYSTANDYSVGDSPTDTWLSKGVKEVRSVLGFPGNLIPSRKIHLIILGGHEEYRAYELIKEIEPTRISIGYGDGTEVSTSRHQATNEAKVKRLQSLVENVEEFVFSCYDPYKTEIAIADLIARVGDTYNIIIAPMNTKISTLGAARFAAAGGQAQICYAQPERYNYQNYSLPGDDYYEFQFGDYFEFLEISGEGGP